MHDLVEQYGLLEAGRMPQLRGDAQSADLRPQAGWGADHRTEQYGGAAILATDRMESLGVLLPQPHAALRDALDAKAGKQMQLKNRRIFHQRPDAENV